MARVRADMQRLMDQRDSMLREIEALRNRVAGIEIAISLLDGDTAKGGAGQTGGKSVKSFLLDALQEVGTSGLNAATAVEMANRRGMTLNPGSVSSTLSRFKKDGVVVLRRDRYVLPDFVASEDDATVTELWRAVPRIAEAPRF